MILKMAPLILIGLIVGASSSIADNCTWGWEEDNCSDVLCPSGCNQTALGGWQSNCAPGNGYNICCNCWFRERICWQATLPVRCYRSVPPAPNAYYWLTVRQEAAGPCASDGQYGKTCLTAEVPD